MKTLLTFLTITTASLLSALPAQAGGFWGYVQYNVSCAPVYSHTVELGRECIYKCATDYCGRTYRYPVVVVTYADYYTDGSRTVYTRSARA